MKNCIKFLLGLALAIAGTQAQAILLTGLSVDDCNLDPNCYPGPSGPPANTPTIAEIEDLVNVSGLFELYKQDQGAGFDTGSFASSYETVFSNTSGDPQDATISYVGGDSIACPECFLLVKDGSADPNWYVFNLLDWDGMDIIELRGFWPENGAISHVTIYGNSANVPEPGILALLGLGLVAFGIRRRLS